MNGRGPGEGRGNRSEGRRMKSYRGMKVETRVERLKKDNYQKELSHADDLSEKIWD